MALEQQVQDWATSAEPMLLDRLKQTGATSAGTLRKHLAAGFLIAHAKINEGSTKRDGPTLTVGDITQLDAVGGSAESWVFPLRPSGRGTFAEFISLGRTSNNDVVIPDLSVSKFHAFFREKDGAITLVDAGSHNGTFVDGKKVPPKQHNQAVVLYDGARLRFGSVEVLFVTSEGLAKLLGPA